VHPFTHMGRRVVAAVFALVAVVSGSKLEVEKEIDVDAAFDQGRFLQESGSGSPPPPPPPSPLSPPGAPGARVVIVYKAVVTMVAAGAVEDYTAERRTNIAAAIAAGANVSASAVKVTITDGSVVIQSTITLPSATEAATVTDILSTQLATPESSTAFFASAPTPVAVTVVSAPVVVDVTETVVQYPPTPPSPPIPMAGDDSMDGGAIAGAVIGSLIGAALIVAGVMFAMKNGGGSSSSKEPAGVMFTSVNPNAQENV